MSRFIVYGLKDPRNGAIFYVGKSCRGLTQAKRHLSEWHQRVDNNSDKIRKIAQIMCAGYQPEVVVISVHRSKRDLVMAETKTIRTWTKSGIRLVNRTNNRLRGQSGLSNTIQP